MSCWLFETTHYTTVTGKVSLEFGQGVTVEVFFWAACIISINKHILLSVPSLTRVCGLRIQRLLMALLTGTHCKNDTQS